MAVAPELHRLLFSSEMFSDILYAYGIVAFIIARMEISVN